MDAGCNHSLGFLQSKNPRPKIRMDGRQDVGCFQSLGFSRSENPRPKIRMDADFGQRKG
jgi:hypothetical protein